MWMAGQLAYANITFSPPPTVIKKKYIIGEIVKIRDPPHLSELGFSFNSSLASFLLPMKKTERKGKKYI